MKPYKFTAIPRSGTIARLIPKSTYMKTRTYRFYVAHLMKNIESTNPKTAFMKAKQWAKENGYPQRVAFRH